MTTTSTTGATTGAAATPAAATAGAASRTTLAGNFNDFLKLLMTQLQNQDPTAPMDTNQFTQQLVQFSSVEQQINTNTSLTKLIEATQGNTLLQSSALVGQRVGVASDSISLQDGTGSIQFTTATPQPVAIGIYSGAGVKLRDVALTSTAGTNTWTWDGKGPGGQAMPDGAYKVVAAAADGTALPFTVQATATGVRKVDGAMKVALGGMQVDFAAVQSVGAGAGEGAGAAGTK